MPTEIEKTISNFKNTPILFIGSGITRRYLDLPNWDDLLKYFATYINNDDFSYAAYKNKAKNSLPLTATYIEEDFNTKWFHNPSFRTITDASILDSIKHNSLSPFKAEVAKYISSKKKINPLYRDEIQKLRSLTEKNISGIITTNYDNFVNEIAPNYRVFVGQHELIFSALQEIGEIYKIHGSIDNPSSLIINKEDYINFKNHEKYLAAKLLTLFMEYPVIFLGYSINDQNIRSILSNISECLNNNQLEELQQRLIFIEHNHTPSNKSPSTNTFSFDGRNITMTKISLYDYSYLYDALSAKRRTIPVSLIRIFKNEFYNYAISNNPDSAVMPVATLEDPRVNNDDLMIAIGKKSDLTPIGLVGIKVENMYRDILFDDFKFDADQILTYAYPEWSKSNPKLPIFKYLHKATKKYPLIEKAYSFDNFDEFFLNKGMIKNRNSFRKCHSQRSVKDVISNKEPNDQKVMHLCYLLDSEINIDQLKNFLCELISTTPDIFKSGGPLPNMKVNLRRLIRIYDWLKYGKQ